MRGIEAELGCMDGSPWVQETNVVLLESLSGNVVEDLLSSSEVSLMIGGRSVHDAAEGRGLGYVAQDHDYDLGGETFKRCCPIVVHLL